MKVWEAIGNRLLSGTAVTAIVGANVYHGEKPQNKKWPSINYFQVSQNILAFGEAESIRYQISCRAVTPEAAMDLGYAVENLFHNMQEVINSEFDVNNGTVVNMLMIKEPDTDVFHVPVDIRLSFYASENV